MEKPKNNRSGKSQPTANSDEYRSIAASDEQWLVNHILTQGADALNQETLNLVGTSMTKDSDLKGGDLIEMTKYALQKNKELIKSSIQRIKAHEERKPRLAKTINPQAQNPE